MAGKGLDKEADITSTGVAFTVDLGDPKTGIIGYKAKRHADVIDVENSDHYGSTTSGTQSATEVIPTSSWTRMTFTSWPPRKK